MRAIILSAGQGKRLLPLTQDTPKCLLEVSDGVSVLSHQLQALAACGIEEAVGKHLDEKHLAGAVTMVLREGHIVHFESHGWRDLKRKTPMTKDSIFRIYSMTKPIVSAGVIMLVEDGEFALDDAVEEYIP